MGQNYVGKYFPRMGNNILFVLPTNRLLQEKDVEATTCHQLEVLQLMKMREKTYHNLILHLLMWWRLMRSIIRSFAGLSRLIHQVR